jgi:hypothetical protein
VATWEIKGGGGGTSSKGSVIGSGTLNNLTDTWTPLWYTSLGPTVYNLVVTCDKKEETVDTWTSTIVLCDTELDRYPTHSISLANLLPDPCKACALSFSGETLPVNEVGSTFTGSVDGEWSNQLNWKDVDDASPAGTLPGIPALVGVFTDDIVIEGDVLSCSLDAMPQVNVLTTDGGNIGISLSAVTATISGSSKVLLNGDCDTGGVLYVTDPAIFIDSSQNAGSVIGDAVFKNSARLRGYVSGNVEFRNTSVMANDALTHASCGGNLDAYDTASVVDSDIVGNLVLHNGSHTDYTFSFLGTVSLHDTAYIGSGWLKDFTGPATFDGNSYNLGTVDGDAEFTGTTYNSGTVTGTAAFSDGCNNSGTVEGNATFTGNSWNNFGTIKSNASFTGNGINWNIVKGNATFSDGAFNMGGTIKGNATFNGSNGNFVNGATSGASGTVTRVVLETGSWAAGDAQGRLIFASVTGTFSSGENIQISATTRAKSGGAQSAITLQPNGRLETTVGNFGGATCLYGADGTNMGFEFDGTVYVPIRTGMTPDTPNHVVVHKQHLFFSFGSSVQFSALGYPYQWAVILGAGEIALTNPVTNFLVQPGDQSTGAMAVYTDSDTFILYGSSSANWSLVSYNTGTGAKAFTAQNMQQSYVWDDRGVINLQAAIAYGNFDSAALTLNIRPFIQSRRNLAIGSSVNREKAQYRVFFSDTYALYLTISNGKLLGAMPVQFPNAATCVTEGETPDGAETSFFGSTNGYVYRLDAGTSFDGVEISAFLILVFNAIRSPRILKRYRRGSLEITGTSYAEFTFSYDLAYSSTDVGQDTGSAYSSSLVSSFWESVDWDNFVWDGRTLAPSEVEVRGTAENIAIRIASISDIYQPFTVNSTILHYSFRRGLR